MKEVVLDSSAWIEYLADGKKSEPVKKYLKTPQNNINLPTIVSYEVYKWVKRERGEAEAIQVVAQMERLSSKIIDLDQSLALYAADLSLKYKLPMADAFVYASTMISDATLITMDEHFKDLPFVQLI